MLDPADGVGEASNPQCGDTIKVYIVVRDGAVAGMKWQTRGCSATMAAGSVLSGLAAGLTLDQASALPKEAIAEALGGLPPGKAHGAIVALEALNEAIADHRRRSTQDSLPA